jgi:iron complex transport system permease protein
MTPLTASKLLRRAVLSLIVLIGVAGICSLVGSERVNLSQVLKGPSADSVNTDYEILVRIRLPRIAAAGLIGAALAVSGVVFQALLRNPLADPYILGISSGAALGAVIALSLGLSATAAWGSPIGLAAFVGAIVTVWAVFGIASASGKRHPATLLLAGVVVNAFLSAVILFLTSVAQGAKLQATVFWLMGNLNNAAVGGGPILAVIAVTLFVVLTILMRLSGALNILSFSPEEAQTVGVNPRRTHRIAFACAALITALAVSVSGLIGFVGLIIPHAVRLVFGPDHRQLIPLSAVVGAAFLILADTVARVVVAPAQLPVGIVTALVGGPFFLLLLLRPSNRIDRTSP